MPAQIPQSSDPRINNWIRISDFSIGCVNNTQISHISAVVPAPNGAADPKHTVNCMALNGGGLGPLPKMTNSFTYPNTITVTYRPLYIVGLASLPATVHGDAIISIMETWHATSHKYQVVSLFPATSAHTTLLTYTFAGALGFFGAPFPALSRMAKSSPTTTPGHPVLIWPSSLPTTVVTTSGLGQLWQYPNITTTASSTPKNLCLGGNITGQVVAYQGRIVVFAGIAYVMGVSTSMNVNENINYTTPSNSQTYKDKMLVLSPEFPYGYGCAGSISAGELFLVKKRGGGIVATGDINFPTVTNLPGVQSTGDFYGNATQTPAGLFYCATSLGAWLWNGGNVSQKISQNLDDDFFVCTHVVPNCNNLGFYCYPWGEWVLFSNSWIYNIRSQSWWKWSTPTLFHYQPGRTTNIMYAAPAVVPANLHYLYEFKKTTPSLTWTWQSLPIKETINHFINVREVVLYASNPATTTSTINVRIYNETTLVFTYTTLSGTITMNPRMVRIATGAVNLNNAIIRLSATGASSAPILHSLTLGTTERQHAGPTH